MTPCKDCQERSEACHDRCPRYKAYKAINRRNKQKRRKEILNRYYGGKTKW